MERNSKSISEGLKLPQESRERIRCQLASYQKQREEIPMKKTTFKSRVPLLAAAAVLMMALAWTATAAVSQIFRQEAAVDTSQAMQGMFGKSRPSWTERGEYDAAGNWFYNPNRETVAVDSAFAQDLLGDALPGTGYQWRIGDYTLTVEAYVVDENTSTAKFYYTLEHPGGFGEGAVDETLGLLNYNHYRVGVTFQSTAEEDPYLGRRRYVDVRRSTAEKLCIVDCAASATGNWKAEDGFLITFQVWGEEEPNKEELSAVLELPGVESLPAVSAASPAGDRLELSAIGVKLPCAHIDEVDYLALEYKDGTQYVVLDDGAHLDNTDYGLGSGERPHMVARYVFNRLVDPSQVTAVVVNSQRYETEEVAG